MMKKLKYDGLKTERYVFETAIMATSQAKVKVKTENSTKPWVEEEDDLDPLATSITADHSF